MIVVIDASTAAEIVLRRDRAEELAGWVERAGLVMAPTLYVAEIGNVFWKYCKLGGLSLEDGETALERALALPDDFADDRSLCREAFMLAHKTKLTVYDMLYLTLARRESGHLLTLDDKLRQAAKGEEVRVL